MNIKSSNGLKIKQYKRPVTTLAWPVFYVRKFYALRKNLFNDFYGNMPIIETD